MKQMWAPRAPRPTVIQLALRKVRRVALEPMRAGSILRVSLPPRAVAYLTSSPSIHRMKAVFFALMISFPSGRSLPLVRGGPQEESAVTQVGEDRQEPLD